MVSASDEIVKAYYANVVQAAQLARTRSQVGFTIASAVTIALGASGLFSDIPERSTGVGVLGAIALACWFGAAFAFLVAVSSPVEPPLTGTFGPEEIAGALLTNVKHERDRVQNRQRVAQGLVGAALLATFATICVLDLFPPSDHTESRRALVTLRWPPHVLRTRPAGCTAQARIAGTLDPAQLQQQVIELHDVLCARGGTLDLPRRTIRAIVLDRAR